MEDVVTFSGPFNRTILELKYHNCNLNCCWRPPFNRTILELKYINEPFTPNFDYAFNRTILELKYHSSTRYRSWRTRF